jgi:hypothetical protein
VQHSSLKSQSYCVIAKSTGSLFLEYSIQNMKTRNINAAYIFEIIIKYAKYQIGLDVNLDDAKMDVHVIKIEIEDICQ